MDDRTMARPDCRQRPLPLPGPRRPRARGTTSPSSPSRKKPFTDLDDAAANAPRRRSTGSRSASWASASPAEGRRRQPRRDGRQVKHTKLFADIVPDLTLMSVLEARRPQHRRAHRRVADVLRDKGSS